MYFKIAFTIAVLIAGMLWSVNININESKPNPETNSSGAK